ncbi:MAG: thiol reductase thioredoxin [Bacteroidales bacterium]|nr:thiol reductase thioredoxin [Bacteroidales bacterium]
MKKVFLIISLLAVFGLFSCNQDSEDASDKSNVQDSEISEQVKDVVSNEKLEDIKPVYLTTADFKDKVWDYESNPEEWIYKGELPCIIDFYADWCKPCKIVAPIMDDLADHYNGKVIIYKVNTDKEKELATVFQVRSIPSILFSPMEGKPAMQPGALSKEDYMSIINDFVLKVNKEESKNI